MQQNDALHFPDGPLGSAGIAGPFGGRRQDALEVGRFAQSVFPVERLPGLLVVIDPLSMLGHSQKQVIWAWG